MKQLLTKTLFILFLLSAVVPSDVQAGLPTGIGEKLAEAWNNTANFRSNTKKATVSFLKQIKERLGFKCVGTAVGITAVFYGLNSKFDLVAKVEKEIKKAQNNSVKKEAAEAVRKKAKRAKEAVFKAIFKAVERGSYPALSQEEEAYEKIEKAENEAIAAIAAIASTTDEVFEASKAIVADFYESTKNIISEMNRLIHSQSILSNGADVNQRTNDDARPLMCAASNGHLEIAKLLLAKGADVNLKDIAGRTALMYAKSRGYLEIAELLFTKQG